MRPGEVGPEAACLIGLIAVVLVDCCEGKGVEWKGGHCGRVGNGWGEPSGCWIVHMRAAVDARLDACAVRAGSMVKEVKEAGWREQVANSTTAP